MERMKKGFSLLELILAMVLLGILVGVSGILMGRGVDAYQLLTNRSDAVQRATLVIALVQRELELLRDVTVSSPERLVFRDGNLQDVEFRLDGTTLYRGGDVLAEDVSSLRFTYYRENGNETSAAPQVRRVHVEMTLQGDGAAGNFALRTDIFPRNFIYENFQ